MRATAIAPTEGQRTSVHRRAHARCFACGAGVVGGLGLRFQLENDGAVAAEWDCPDAGRSYDGILHGGLVATLMDSAMVHALFARNVIARTAELRVRYHQPVRTGDRVTVTARLRAQCGPLYCLAAEVWQQGRKCATAQAKFVAARPDARSSTGDFPEQQETQS